jgi:hypothetical protein
MWSHGRCLLSTVPAGIKDCGDRLSMQASGGDLLPKFGRRHGIGQRWPVWPGLGHRVVHIGRSEDSRRDR